MATGTKSSALPSDQRQTDSSKIFTRSKGFLSKIRRKLQFRCKRQYSFEEQDGVVLTGVYTRRESEESLNENGSCCTKIGRSDIQPNGNANDHHSKRHDIVDRTFSNTSLVSDNLHLRSKIKNPNAELTQEERRKSLIVERQSGLFSAALNFNDHKNDMLVPDDSAIDLDKLSEDTNLDKHFVDQDVIFEDTDPGYEKLGQVRKRIASQVKNPYSLNVIATGENLKELNDSVNSDRLRNSCICSPAGGQDITRDSGLGSPGGGEVGIKGNPLTHISPENRMEESPAADDSVLSENIEAIVNKQNSFSSDVSEQGSNHVAWSSAEIKDLYANPQVLFRKQSHKSAQNLVTTQIQATPGMFVDSVSSGAINNDIMNCNDLICQRTSVDLEGPLLPARKYSMYVDKENTQMSDLVKSKNENTVSCGKVDNLQKISDEAKKHGIKDSEEMLSEPHVGVVSEVSEDTRESMPDKNSTNSVITTTALFPSNDSVQLSSSFIPPECDPTSNLFAAEPFMVDSDVNGADLHSDSCLQNEPLALDISSQSCVESLVGDLFISNELQSNSKRVLANSSSVIDTSPGTDATTRNCLENMDFLIVSPLWDSDSGQQSAEAYDNSGTTLSNSDNKISYQPLDTSNTPSLSRGIMLERSEKQTTAPAQQEIIYISRDSNSEHIDLTEEENILNSNTMCMTTILAEDSSSIKFEQSDKLDDSDIAKGSGLNDLNEQAELSDKLDDSDMSKCRGYNDMHVQAELSDKSDSDINTGNEHNDLTVKAELSETDISTGNEHNDLTVQAELSDKSDSDISTGGELNQQAELSDTDTSGGSGHNDLNVQAELSDTSDSDICTGSGKNYLNQQAELSNTFHSDSNTGNGLNDLNEQAELSDMSICRIHNDMHVQAELSDTSDSDINTGSGHNYLNQQAELPVSDKFHSDIDAGNDHNDLTVQAELSDTNTSAGSGHNDLNVQAELSDTSDSDISTGSGQNYLNQQGELNNKFHSDSNTGNGLNDLNEQAELSDKLDDSDMSTCRGHMRVQAELSDTFDSDINAGNEHNDLTAQAELSDTNTSAGSGHDDLNEQIKQSDTFDDSDLGTDNVHNGMNVQAELNEKFDSDVGAGNGHNDLNEQAELSDKFDLDIDTGNGHNDVNVQVEQSDKLNDSDIRMGIGHTDLNAHAELSNKFDSDIGTGTGRNDLNVQAELSDKFDLDIDTGNGHNDVNVQVEQSDKLNDSDIRMGIGHTDLNVQAELSDKFDSDIGTGTGSNDVNVQAELSDKFDSNISTCSVNNEDLNAENEMLSNSMYKSCLAAVAKQDNFHIQTKLFDKLNVTQCSKITAKEERESDCLSQCPILNDQNRKINNCSSIELIGVQQQNKLHVVDDKIIKNEMCYEDNNRKQMENSRLSGQNDVFEDSVMPISHDETLPPILTAEGTEDEPIHKFLSEINMERLCSSDDSKNGLRQDNNDKEENNFTSPPIVPPRRPRKTKKTARNPRHAFIESMRQLKECGWYWGPLNYEEACSTLSDKADGSFLVRDSSDDRHILSLSFKSHNEVHHIRIEHQKGMFSFWSQPQCYSRGSIKEFIDQNIENCREGKFLYCLKHPHQVTPPIRVHLKKPISRFVQVQSLCHMCRFSILQAVRRDNIDELPVPQRVKVYLKRPQYYVEMENDEI